MWGQVETNKKVGGLFPNDGDGNAWGDKVVGFPPVLEKLGYTLTDPGRFQNLSDDFSAQINAFKQANAEIVTGVVIHRISRPSGARRSSRASSQRLPRWVRLCRLANGGIARRCWPQSLDRSLVDAKPPFKSSLTGETAAQVADAFTKATGRPWTQPIGCARAVRTRGRCHEKSRGSE